MAPRPPAPILNTPSTVDPLLDDYEEEDFEKEFLHMDSESLPVQVSLSTPSPPTDDQMETERDNSTSEKLLALRKEYKRNSVALAKAEAHRHFIASCKYKKQTPKGLRVNVQCSAFLADITNVQKEFKETSNLAQEEYVTHLDSHYNIVLKELNEKQALVKDTMTTLQTQATEEEKEVHLGMLTKTNDNVQKLNNELKKRKERKLDTITQPSRKKRREDRENGQANTSPPSLFPRMRSSPPSQTQSPRQQHQAPLQQFQQFQQQAPLQQFQAPQPNQPNLLSMTLGDLFAGLQRQAAMPLQLQPTIIPAHCTPVSVQPPPLVHPGGKVGLGRPPQPPRSFQQDFGQRARLFQQ